VDSNAGPSTWGCARCTSRPHRRSRIPVYPTLHITKLQWASLKERKLFYVHWDHTFSHLMLLLLLQNFFLILRNIGFFYYDWVSLYESLNHPHCLKTGDLIFLINPFVSPDLLYLSFQIAWENSVSQSAVLLWELIIGNVYQVLFYSTQATYVD
jgi:hypothetical protein